MFCFIRRGWVEEWLVDAAVGIFRIGKRAGGGDGSLACRESAGVGDEVPYRQLLVVGAGLMVVRGRVVEGIPKRAVGASGRGEHVLRSGTDAVRTGCASNVAGQLVGLLHIGNVRRTRSTLGRAGSASSVVLCVRGNGVVRASGAVERRLVSQTGSQRLSSADRRMALVGRVATGRNRARVGRVAVAAMLWDDGAGPKGARTHGGSMGAVKVRVRVGHVLRLLLASAYTGNRVRVAAKCGQRRQLRSWRDGARLTETRLVEVVLVGMLTGKRSDRGSVVVRVLRHRWDLVGEVAVLVVTTDLGLVLLHTCSVLGKHGGRTRAAVLVVSSHGAHGTNRTNRTSRTGADAGLVLWTKVVVLIVFGHFGRHATCTAAVAFVRLKVVGDHGRVALEGVTVERIGLVRVILLVVLLEQETDQTGEHDDTNEGTSNDADDGAG